MARGGAEEYALAIAREARQRDWAIHVALPAGAATQSLQRDFQALGVIHVDADFSAPPPPSRANRLAQLLFDFARMHRVARRAKPDVVSINLPWHDRAGGAILACACRGIPTMVVFHLMPRVQMAPAWRRAMMRFALGRSQRWVAVSDDNRASIIGTFGVPPSRVLRVYNGVETVEHDEVSTIVARKALRSELGVADDAVIGVTIGRLHEQKGQQDLIRALPAIRKRHDLRLVLVGTGPLEKELAALAQQCGVAEAIVFVGHQDDVRHYLEGADVFFMPSLWEGLPHTLLEAMSYRVPLVVSDVGPFREVVSDGVHGVVHRAGDPKSLAERALWALEHPDDMQQMAMRAAERVRTSFSREGMLQATFAAFDELLSEGRC